MRIRRRPQAQALIPSDPSQPPDAPPDHQHWPPPTEEKRKPEEPPRLPRRPNADLGEEPQPQWHGGNVVARSGDAQGRGRGGGAQRLQAGAAADGHAHGSLENGRRDERDCPPAIDAAAQHLAPAMPVTPTSPAAAGPVHAKEGSRSDGPKRRRGPAVLLEGSRCSRVNGRGWRCSQPTLVGYSLCEHHLGKGRQSRSANGGGGGRSTGAPKLGRTEPAGGRKSAAAAALAVVAAALPDATEPAAAHLTADQFY